MGTEETKNISTKPDPARGTRLMALAVTLISETGPFAMDASGAHISDGSVVYIRSSEKRLDSIREAIHRYDAGEMQTYQEEAKG